MNNPEVGLPLHCSDSITPPTPAAMPIVTMDIALGREAESIEFDYYQFYKMAESYGISDAEITRLRINFNATPSSLYLGTYAHLKRMITIRGVGFGPVQSDKESQTNVDRSPNQSDNVIDHDHVLRHEAGHWVNELTEKKGLLYRRINLASYTSLGALGVAGAITLPVQQQNPWLMLAAPIPLGLAMLGMASIATLQKKILGISSAHREMPHEKPAYEFEEHTRDFKILKVVVKRNDTTHEDDEPESFATAFKKVMTELLLGTIDEHPKAS